MCEGQLFGTVVKMSVGMPASQAAGTGFESWLCSQFYFPANVEPGKRQGMAQVLGSLSPMWET